MNHSLDDNIFVDSYMILRVLENLPDHSTKFFEYKANDEFVGIAVLSKESMNLNAINCLHDDISYYFKYGINKTIDWNILNYKMKDYYTYQAQVENYIKAVWLAHDFIVNKGFKNPVGCFWNPRNHNWSVHPGGSRQKILKLFGDENIETLCFNTGGVSCEFKKIFTSFDDITSYYNSNDISLVIVADHGSLIPHIHFDQEQIFSSVKYYYNLIKDFYNTTSIESNFDMSQYGYIKPKRGRKIKITLDNPDSEIEQFRAFLLVPTFDNYNDYGVKIESS